MNRVRLAALAVTVAIVSTVALVGQGEPKSSGGKMQVAAAKFVASLSPELKTKGTFAFDDAHRLKWYFTPQQAQRKFTRKGVRLEEMGADQKAAAMALLKTGLSAKGYEQATTILTLEGLLADLEGSKGGMVRNTGWYFVSVFGEPAATGKWGWRFEGHHLSVNYTLDNGEVVSATPLLFAANPADVKAGDKKGLRALPAIEDHARSLIKSFDEKQDAAARQGKEFAEIKEGQPRAEVGNPVGIPAADLSGAQRETLAKLLGAYLERMPEDIAAAEDKRAKNTPPGKLFFAYSGSPVPGKPYTYRIYAPEFVVEFLNVQADSARNPANHIHSAWRRLPSDFALSE
jgi:Protein of unknown function (DUF3500)